jgi:hypothetical protein
VGHWYIRLHVGSFASGLKMNIVSISSQSRCVPTPGSARGSIHETPQHVIQGGDANRFQ